MKNPERFLIFKIKQKYIHHDNGFASYPSGQPDSIFRKGLWDLLVKKNLLGAFTFDMERLYRRLDVWDLKLRSPRWAHYLIPKNSPHFKEVKKIVPKEAIILKTVIWDDLFFSKFMEDMKAEDIVQTVRDVEREKKRNERTNLKKDPKSL